MKKVLLSLLILALAAPALADVAVTAAQVGTSKVLRVTVTPSGTAAVRGVALVLETTDGNAALAAGTDVVTAGLNTFIDYGFSVPTGFNVGVGNAAAQWNAAGVVATYPAPKFSVCAGYLAPSGQLGQTNAITFDVTYAMTSTSTIAISLDTLRGGIVGDTLGTVTVAPTATITLASAECVKTTAPFYADWVAFGKPNCWCYAKNCRGDVDGLKQGNSVTGYVYVFTNDLNKFLAAYNIKEAPKGPGVASVVNGICADFDHARQGNSVTGYIRVFTNDLNIFLASYNVKEPPKGPGVPDCDMANYNFFVAP